MQKRRVGDKSELVKSTEKCFLEKEKFQSVKETQQGLKERISGQKKQLV